MERVEEKKQKFRINVINVFIILFVISFLEIANLSFIRYIAILLLQVICIYEIRFDKISIDKKMLLLIFGIIITMSFSLFRTGYTFEAIAKMATVIDLFFLTLILLPNYLKNCDLDIIIKNIRNDIFIVLIFCFVFYNNDYSISYDMERIGNLIRLKCGFPHPNTLSMFSFIGIILSIYLITIRYHIKSNFIFIFFFLYLIIKANSRTALYCIIIFIMLCILGNICKNKKLKPIIYIIVISFSILIIGIGTSIVDGLTFDRINQLLSNRLSYIISAINVLTSNNAILTGMGAFRNSATFTTNAVMLDNGYFNYIYQYGIISFLVLICFLVNNFFKIKNDNNRNMEMFVKNAYIIFGIYSFFENILLNMASLFAILIYFFIAMIQIQNKKQ